MLACRLSPSNCTSLIFKRHISNAASKHEVRMRALVSLYHQCDSFITPENLSQKIDEAFVPQSNIINGSPNFEQRSYAELRRLVAEREEQPRHVFTKGGKPSSVALRVVLASSSPNSEQQRTARATEALLGTGTDGKPLWTAVKKGAQKIKEELIEDRQQGI